MNHLQSLNRICPTGTAEGEVSFLSDIFITPDNYIDSISPPERSPRILVGKKGSGKSAIGKFLVQKCSDANIPGLFLTPDDFNLSTATGTNISELKRIFKDCIIEKIALKIGAELPLFVSSDTDRKLIETAITSGIRQPDFITKLSKMLMNVPKKWVDIDLAAFLPTDQTNNPDLLSLIKEKQGRNNSAFYVVIDDIDQVANAEDPISLQLNRIWAFILASRKVSEEVPGLVLIILVRTEIWKKIENDTSDQRDQLDHVRRLVKWHDPSEDSMKLILKKRLEFALKDPNKTTFTLPRLIEEFFEESRIVLPGSEEKRYWSDFLIKSSRERPRDLIQHLGMLTEKAILNKLNKISSSVAEGLNEEYSTYCAKDICNEFSRESKEFQNLLAEMCKFSWISTSELFLQQVQKIPSAFKITIRNTTMSPNSRPHAFLIWSLLYEAGVVNARVPDENRERGFYHIMYREDPQLVSEGNWNVIQKYEWEIHPAFRSYLMKERRKRGISNMHNHSR